MTLLMDRKILRELKSMISNAETNGLIVYKSQIAEWIKSIEKMDNELKRLRKEIKECR